MDYYQELYHHGILGQKWGVRRYQNEDGTLTEAGERRKKALKKPSQFNVHGEVSKDYQNLSNANREASNIAMAGSRLADRVAKKQKSEYKEDLSSLSDKEIRDRINRMNLERQYNQLKASDKKRGAEHASEILAIVGDSVAIAASIAGIMVAIHEIKKQVLTMESWRQELYRDELYHHGIKGQKWGVRRFQNKDGTLTKAGQKRYGVVQDALKKANDEVSRLNDYKSTEEKAINNRKNRYSGEKGFDRYLEDIWDDDEMISEIKKDKDFLNDEKQEFKDFLDYADKESTRLINYYSNEIKKAEKTVKKYESMSVDDIMALSKRDIKDIKKGRYDK